MNAFVKPLLIAAACSCGAWYFDLYPKFGDPSALVTFGGTLSSVGATMLGFMLAALAVLASIANSHLVSQMHRTGHYQDLLNTLFAGCIVFLVCTALGFMVVFNVTVGPAFMAATVGLHVAAAVSLIEVGRRFWLVLRNLRAE